MLVMHCFIALTSSRGIECLRIVISGTSSLSVLEPIDSKNFMYKLLTSGMLGLHFNLVGQCVLIKTALLHSIYLCHSRKLNSFVSQIPSSLIALKGKKNEISLYQ